MTNQILLAGASFGWGHIQAAENVGLALLDNHSSCSIQTIDVLDFLPPGLSFLCKASWRAMSSHARNAYSPFYRRLINCQGGGKSIGFLARYAATRIAALTNPPDVFVATHSFAVLIGSLMKERFNCKLCVVTTDFMLHQMQIVPGVDCFFLPPAYECSAPVSNGNNGKVLDTGIPISSDFTIGKNVDEIKSRLGLSRNLATVLVSFGGSGLRAERHIEIFSKLLESDLPLQFVVLAGRNFKFAQAVRERYATHRHSERIKIYGFVEGVSDFYSVADLFVGKAGGLSISEALAVGLPVTIIDFLPGQEEANLRVLTSNALGTYVNNTNELKKHIELLLKKFGKHGGVKEIHEFARPFSSKVIATRVAAMAL